ncbi:mitochondrial ATP synthase B chain precursor [Clostridium puniceum]|uniref:Mitochondrial ATP synthase B chain n=1 Tax=Clostridium puniceum TaxID=29367 RepID=A0A1S8TL98_9CLOT|nr:DUF4363 family protein [Clostridium puniceum]OOM78491.1 mitochondrial ATP synthase B chain precursor [Clostridium puniceum]
MRKFLVITIPIVTLTIFIFIMFSSSILKPTFKNGNSIPESIQSIIQDIELENWDAANSKTDKLKITWEKVIKKVQFSSERDEINSFSTNIARLKGSIKAKDQSNSYSELNEALDHWTELGN